MKTSPLSRFAPIFFFGLLALAPLFLGDFRLSLLGQFLALGIVALGIDLIWGYTGILSLGHAVYFGLGAYCTAMFLKLEAVKGALPDFMDWNGLTALPIWWKPFHNGAFAIAMSMILPAFVAMLLGYFTFRNRIKGVFFSILSQALAIITVTFFIGQQAYTGGTNGITDFSTAFGFPINDKRTQTVLFYLSLALLIATYFGCKKLVSGKFGQILLAIRDGENRLRFTGYNPTTYKVFIYAFSAALAGLAGALYVPQIGIVSPSQMGIVPSIGMVLWVAIGGRGTLSGAVLGAILVNGLQNLLSESYPAVWQFFIGATFVIVVLFLPRGVMGLIGDLSLKTRSRKPAEAAPAQAVTA
ncbi:urea ABC transporter membrane protein [Abditibacterium utsteinense]|uniref:Urea ABC transporter membrane protein n=1 Tax=Abditibacterium utsteinense TaxID=1960156 RepID=A0A2S8SWL7_9BACT|nr:urea ABC transporter permease subunit UrtC [Abditibacterium utsteinense]PQV65195.1 urea ABC transporter membrane protein [Abditibacterium utsteinense]